MGRKCFCGRNITSLRQSISENYNQTKIIISKQLAIETAQHLYGSNFIPDNINTKRLQDILDNAFKKREFQFKVIISH